MTESQPSDAELNGLSGVTDSETGFVYPVNWTAPYRTLLYRWLRQMLHISRRGGDLRVYQDGDLTFGVRAGLIRHGATTISYAGATAQALTDDDTNYVYLTSAGVLTVNITGFPADPEAFPLATIAVGTESAEAVSGTYDADDDITDYRGRICWHTHAPDMYALDSLVSHRQALADHHGDFEIVDGGWGTGTFSLRGDAIQNATIVNTLSLEFVLPREYEADEDVNLVVEAKVDDSGGGTLGTCTIDAEVYELDDEGAVGADLCATAAIAVTNAFASKTFVITDTGLSPGDRLRIFIQTSVEENADAGTLRAVLGSIDVQCDRRG